MKQSKQSQQKTANSDLCQEKVKTLVHWFRAGLSFVEDCNRQRSYEHMSGLAGWNPVLRAACAKQISHLLLCPWVSRSQRMKTSCELGL
jgi:hypothetical protein